MLLVPRSVAVANGTLGKTVGPKYHMELLMIVYSGTKHDITTRTGTDHVAVLNLDERGPDGLYGLHELQILGEYRGLNGGKEIDVHGFDVEILKDGRLRFFMINHRPPIDPISGQGLDPKIHGANSTVEIFELKRGTTEWNYVKTIINKVIATPNKPAATGDGGFLITNDHSSKGN